MHEGNTYEYVNTMHNTRPFMSWAYTGVGVANSGTLVAETK